MTVTLLASQCPPVAMPGSFPASAFTVGRAASAPTAPVSEALNYGVAGPLATPSLWNRNAARADLLARFGGGGWAVCDGLTLSGGAGLLASVAPGHAMIDGAVELAAPQSVPVPDNTPHVFVWLLRGAPGGPPAFWSSAVPALPGSPGVLLGSVATSGGAVTGADYSGVVRAHGRGLYRQTADAWMPADSPPADAAFTAVTQGGHFEWDGSAYTGGARARRAITGAVHNVTLTPDTNYLLGWDFSAAGGFADALYAVGMACPDPNLIINEALGGKTPTKLFVTLHYPAINGGTSPVVCPLTPSAKGEGYTGADVSAITGAWDGPAAIG